jgi:DNA-binding PadR family transcriptional regulator
MTTPDNVIPFTGFEPPKANYFKVPNKFWDIEDLTVHERMVLLYILRHTWGYQEFGIYKAITTDEFQHGRKERDGKRQDKGCGVSRGGISNALSTLAKKGYILVETDTSDLARIKKSYMLNMAQSSVHQMNAEFTERTQGSSGDNRTEKETIERNQEKEKKKKEPTPAPMAHPDKTTSPFADTSNKGLFGMVSKHSFKFQEGQKIPDPTAKRIGRVIKSLMQLDPIPSVAEMARVYQYDREVKSNISTPKGESTLVELVQEFRQASDYKQYISDRDRVLSSTDSVSSAPPTMAAIDAALYHAPSPDWIAAQPDYGTPEENAELDRMFADLVTSKRSTKLVGKIPPTLRDVS